MKKDDLADSSFSSVIYDVLVFQSSMPLLPLLVGLLVVPGTPGMEVMMVIGKDNIRDKK